MCLQKPHGLESNDMFSRLKAMNSYLSYIPESSNEEGEKGYWLIGLTPFNHKNLVSIILYMLPEKWQNKMLDSNMRPYLMTLAEMKAYLPNLQKSSGSKHVIPKKKEER